MTASRLLGLVVGLLLVAHLTLLGFFEISSLDTWFHLKEGELYVTTHTLPSQDPFAFTTQGREWIKYSWLSDVVYYLIYAAAGFPGLILFRLGALFLISAILYRLVRRCGLHPLVAILLVLMASLALRFRLYIRPELMSFLLLLAVMVILFRLRDGSGWVVFMLLPVQVIWTNVHASFVFGIGIPGLVLLANLLPGSHMAEGWGHLHLDRKRLRDLIRVVCCLPLATLVNPHGVSLLLFPFRQNGMIRLSLFPEWMGAWQLPEVDPVLWEPVIVFGVGLLIFVVASLLLWVWERRLDPVGWGIVLSIGVYALLRNRAIPYFILAILPFVAVSLARVGLHLFAAESRRRSRRLERIGAIACILLLSASIVDQGILTRRYAVGLGVAPNFFPEQAAAFLEEHRLDGRVFNTYKFGAYLMWRRWPANQVFIDGRYDAVLFDEGLFEEYLRAHHEPAVLDRIAEQYGVEILVLDAEPERRIAFLGADSAWARVYWDAVAEVYVRRAGAHAALALAREYRLTGPETDLRYLAAYRRDVATWNRALQELRRAVKDNPANEVAWQGLAKEYAAAGPSMLPQRLEALDRATSLLPGNPAAGRLHAERAEALLQSGRPVEAAAAARQALGFDGKLLLPHWVLAVVAEQQGAWSEAREQLQTLLSAMGPAHPMRAQVVQRLEAAQRVGGR
jgi:tetratricopeptide (TPR) repeat protein